MYSLLQQRLEDNWSNRSWEISDGGGGEWGWWGGGGATGSRPISNILAKKWTALINSWQEKVRAICLICVFLFNGSKNTVVIFEFFTFWNTTQNCALKIRILGAWMDFDWWWERERRKEQQYSSPSCSHLNGIFLFNCSLSRVKIGIQ